MSLHVTLKGPCNYKNGKCAVCREVATLRAENERLKAELAEERGWGEKHYDRIEALKAELAEHISIALKFEVQRDEAREALRELEGACNYTGLNFFDHESRVRARAVLAKYKP